MEMDKGQGNHGNGSHQSRGEDVRQQAGHAEGLETPGEGPGEGDEGQGGAEGHLRAGIESVERADREHDQGRAREEVRTSPAEVHPHRHRECHGHHGRADDRILRTREKAISPQHQALERAPGPGDAEGQGHGASQADDERRDLRARDNEKMQEAGGAEVVPRRRIKRALVAEHHRCRDRAIQRVAHVSP